MEYSSFSQLKGLTWFQTYKDILKWEDKKGNLPEPIGATIDLTTICNLRCNHCNSQHSWEIGKTQKREDVEKQLIILKTLGCKSICFAGGGEPTLVPWFKDIIQLANEMGFEVGISSNFTTIDLKTMHAIAKYATFCGVSLDAGNPETYNKIKKAPLFNRVMDNLDKMVKIIKRNNSKLDFVVKFLINNDNQKEIYDACFKTYAAGVKTFYVRPAGFHEFNFDVYLIENQMKRCQDFAKHCREDLHQNFIVQSSFSRVNPETYGKIHNFKVCHATPLLIQICADGNVYQCIDKRYRLDAVLCHWTELMKYWGSAEHRQKVKEINLEACPRCAFGNYNEQIEKCVIRDDLYWKFP